MKKENVQDSKAFCMMPFMCLHNMSNGLMKMCCITESPIVDDFGQTLFIGNQPIEEVWNSNFIKSARKKMLNDESISPCDSCYKIEKTGGKSLRQSYNEQFFDVFKEYVDEANNNDGNIHSFPPFIELRSGNTCNSACRMCNTNDSSLIYKENTHIHHTLNHKINDPDTVHYGYLGLGDPEHVIFGSNKDKMRTRVLDLDTHYDEIIKNITSIKVLTLSGGEPFLLDKTIVLLEEIAAKNPSMTLYINTNGSILTDKIITALKKIKEVRICISIDGYGSVQEYIRYPLKWNKIEKNIIRLNQHRDIGFFINFNVTVQAYNIFNLKEILAELIVKYPGNHVNLSILTNPDYFCIQNLPPKAKDLAYQRNLDAIKVLDEYKVTEEWHKPSKDQVIGQLRDINSYMIAEEYDEELFKRLKANVKIYDYYRKQNIEDYIPDWKEFL